MKYPDVNVLLVVSERDLTIQDSVPVTRDDEFGWLFEHLYLRRFGFKVTVVSDSSDVLNIITEAAPDLVVWLAHYDRQEYVLQVLSRLHKTDASQTEPLTFVLTSTTHPDPEIRRLASTAESIVIDPQRFLAIVNDLLQHKDDKNYQASYELPLYGIDMSNHPDAEIQAFFGRMIKKYGR